MKALGNRMIPIAENINLYHLHHEIEASDMTALEIVLSSDNRQTRYEKEIEDLSNALTDENIDEEQQEDISNRLSLVYEELESLTVEDPKSKACHILNGLQFTQEMMNRPSKQFSGGWRMRIALSCALFMQPTLLLLDEPTNHLDMEAVVWLEDYLSQWKGCLLIISHSQDFMNNVCNQIIHLTQKRLE